MASSRFPRRDFLKVAGMAGVAMSLPGCSTLDSVILGDDEDARDRVAILGAGFAGLMAAYELRKQGVPVRVFEASARLGGRSFTVPEFFRGQTIAELGAEWFSADHRLIVDLASELRLEVFETKGMQERMKARQLNRFVKVAELNREFSRFQRSLSKSGNPESLAAQSLMDWSLARSKDAAFQDLVNDWSLETYGVTADRVAASSFAPTFDQARPVTNALCSMRYRFRGGTSVLAQAMFDRTAGFQPAKTYSFRHKLKAVRKLTDSVELIFDTPEGERSYRARQVICALPLGCLSEIDGIKNLPGPWADDSALQMGAHSKFIYSFDDRFWAKEVDQTRLLGFGDGLSLWESSYRLNPLFQFRQGVISILWGGEASKAAGPKHQASFEKDFESLFEIPNKVTVMDQVMVNWSLQPFAKGSVSYPVPGANPQVWNQASEQSQEWIWAGEHTGYLDRGLMLGALDSGRRAAQLALSRRRNSAVVNDS